MKRAGGPFLVFDVYMSTTTCIRIGFLLSLLVTAGVSAPRAAAPPTPAAEWEAALGLPTVQDLNPDPRILEITLEARLAQVEISPGRRVEAWTYNGGIPGPLIRLRVGDRLIVHFTNRLPAPTTVHWHGVRLGIEMDGV